MNFPDIFPYFFARHEPFTSYIYKERKKTLKFAIDKPRKKVYNNYTNFTRGRKGFDRGFEV